MRCTENDEIKWATTPQRQRRIRLTSTQHTDMTESLAIQLDMPQPTLTHNTTVNATPITPQGTVAPITQNDDPINSHTTIVGGGTTMTLHGGYSPIDRATSSSPLSWQSAEPPADENSIGLVAFTQSIDAQIIASALPLPIIPSSDMAILTDGPYERVVIPSVLSTGETGPIGSHATVYGTWRGRAVVLMRLHPGASLQPAVWAEFENQINLMSELPERLELSVVQLLGRTTMRGGQYVVLTWKEDGIVQQFLRLYGPSQAHRIQRVKRTVQMMNDLQKLYEKRIHPEPSSIIEEMPPNIAAMPAKAVLDIPPEELTFVLDAHGERKRVGHGAFAIVYLGRFEHRLVAIKKAHQQLSACAVASIEKEVAMMHETRSPYIVRVEGTCKKDGEYLIVLEYLHHGDLFHYLEEHDPVQISWTLRLKWMRQLAEGLKLLHRNNIAHRDQKSPNVLLDGNLNLKLTDFGLSNYLDESNAPKAAGSPPWMAPEQFKRPPQAGCMIWKLLFSKKKKDKSKASSSSSKKKISFLKADVWSFGFVMVEIMTGKRPFWKVQHDVEHEVIRLLRDLTPQQLKQHIPSFPDSCPAVLCDLIHSCLTVDPICRPSMEDISRSLHRIPDIGYETLKQFRESHANMVSMVGSIDSFNHVRTLIGYYALWCTDEEMRQFESALVQVDEIRTWLMNIEEKRPCAQQPTHPDVYEDLPKVDTSPSPHAFEHQRAERNRTLSNPSSTGHTRTPSPTLEGQPYEMKEEGATAPTQRKKHLASVAGKWCSSQVGVADIREYEARMAQLGRMPSNSNNNTIAEGSTSSSPKSN